MSRGILNIERMILESLAVKEKDLKGLSVDTKINESITKNFLSHLMMRNLVKYEKGKYQINHDQLGVVSKEESYREEIKELLGSLVNLYFSKEAEAPALKLKKISLTPSEELIFNSHLKNLENFIEGIKRERELKPIATTTGDQKIIFWGHSDYANLINAELREAI
jgi:hypothetical protein